MREGPLGSRLTGLFQAAVRPAGGRARTEASRRCDGRLDLALAGIGSDGGMDFG